MTRPDETDRRSQEAPSDRALWRQCQAIDAAEDEAARLLDLAGFADGRLDPDERERVAALIAADPAAKSDVAAAGELAAAAAPMTEEGIIARATALVDPDPAESTRVIRLIPARRRFLSWPKLAEWSSLAAAIAIASWLGFAMGSDTSRVIGQLNQPSDDAVAQDIFQSSTGLTQDWLGGGQT